MKVNVRLFAGLHDLLGKRDVVLELAEDATVLQLPEQLAKEYPIVTPYLTTLVCAVDEEYVPSEHRLQEGDEVALIPPISGGGSEYVPSEHRLQEGDEVAFVPPISGGSSDAELFEVTAEPLDSQRLVEAVRKDESGAVALFFGVARNHSEGRRVRALEYEAYASMAEKKLREVGDEVRARWPITGIGVLHRTGRLAIGEASLLVAVSAAHRKEAFEACHYAVDRIKETVPIWKKEIWEDGEGEGAWVAGHPVEAPRPVSAEPGA